MNLHEAFDQIRQWVGDRAATSYTRSGCRVSMADLPRERVVLDVDLAFPVDRAVEPQCDLILFYSDTIENSIVGVPMELKSGNVDASVVIQQLQAGARIVDRLVPKEIKTSCIPVLVYGGQMHRKQRRKQIKPSKVNFRSQKFSIYTTRCGYEGNLADALKKSGSLSSL